MARRIDIVIEIETIRKYFDQEDVLISEHAAKRFRQRGLRIKDIRFAVGNGKIIEQYPKDFPYPSCLLLGKSKENRIMHIVVSDEGSMSRIITAYYPDKWNVLFYDKKGMI